jgi:hypothetical protein
MHHRVAVAHSVEKRIDSPRGAERAQRERGLLADVLAAIRPESGDDVVDRFCISELAESHGGLFPDVVVRIGSKRRAQHRRRSAVAKLCYTVGGAGTDRRVGVFQAPAEPGSIIGFHERSDVRSIAIGRAGHQARASHESNCGVAPAMAAGAAEVVADAGYRPLMGAAAGG